MYDVIALNGLLLSCIYLLISTGFSLVYGVFRIFYFGFTITYTFVPYLTWIFWKDFNLALPMAFAIMIVLQILYSIASYKWCIKPNLADEGRLFMATLLIWIFFEELINFKYPIVAGVNFPAFLKGEIRVGSINLALQLLACCIISIALILSLAFFLLKTKIGLSIRAVSQDRAAAELMGIDVDRVYLYAMIISIFPPTICLVMIAPFWEISPYMGFPLLLTALIISIIGGLGNLKGTIIASFIIGFLHSQLVLFSHQDLQC